MIPRSRNFDPKKPLPGKLSHKLDINVGALLPGSAPPRREKIQTPETKTEELNNEDPDFVRTPISILRTQSETHPITREYRLEKSVSFDNAAEVEVLHNVTKNRPKIPIKRRPSSRKARQQYLRNSVPDFQIEDESTLREKYEKRSVKDLSSKNSTDNQHLLVSQISTSKQDINMQNEIIQSLEYLSTKSPEHSLQVEKEMRNEPASRTLEAFNSIEEQKTILLFDDEEDDSESLFRIIQPNNGSTINHTKRVALKKEEPSPLKPDTTTGGIDELLDPLNDNEEIWERSTSFPKTKSPFTSSGETGVNESSSKRNEKVKISTTTLFDSSDEEDDFFNSLSKTKIGKQETNRSKTISNSKIGSKLFDDERTAEHDIEPSVIKKITPKSSNLRKLQNVEVEEDPLSAMLK
ncbi:hypothetical protein WA026_012664 [Henosepilachna vigintioctopunctata]|uniref:FAM21/CAPZIP domain-containing protein n=1 Tax=Henosepilachna vigintioctopunctata TaxID=420089 RepID=A0AAW1U1G5_9CUCU